MTKKRLNDALFYFALFAGTFCIFFFTPYVVDDFLEKLIAYNCTWKECIKHAIFYGNGRFLGNIGLYACLHSDMIRAFVKPLIITITSLCFSYLFNLRYVWEKILVIIALVIPSQGFFSNLFINNPSFYNYVVPISLFLAVLSIIKYIEKKQHNNPLLAISVLIISFCMQLFSEHSSLIFIMFSFELIVYSFYCKKKPNLSKIFMFLGSIIGFAVMMLLPKYLNTIGEMKYNMSEYRSFFVSIPYIIGTLAKFAEIFTSAIIVIVLLSAVEIFIVCKTSDNSKQKNIKIIIPIVYTTTSLLYTFVQGNDIKVSSIVKVCMLFLFCVYLINTLLILWEFLKSKNDKIIIFSLIILAMIASGMFALLNQHGYRTFYLSLCIVIAIVLYIYNILKKNYGLESLSGKIAPILNKSLICFSICFTFILSMLMIQNYTVVLMREKYVSEKINQRETEIKVPKLPNKQILYENYMQAYKKYLKNGNENVEIVFVELDEWENYEEYQSLQDNPAGNLIYVLKNYNFNKPNINE